MDLHQKTAEIYVPNGLPVEQALGKTTHLCIAAHQDDIEIMAAQPVLECFQQKEKWFTGVVVSDGRGSPRDGLYKDFSDEEMRLIRFQEQRKAAFVGEYAAVAMLDHPSAVIKDAARLEPVEDIVTLLGASRPRVVYTHNLADKHDTHVAVTLRVIQALRSLPKEERPARLLGCEVWRGLDWMLDAEKVVLDLSAHENLQTALLGVFDSQIAGGKRYDLATLGRRRANATYFESHDVDSMSGAAFAMDLTPLIEDDRLDPADFVHVSIQHFEQDVRERINRINQS
ncbi:MAG: PIG-L family deacetylase [Anaerolineaceae bacterium]|nr:PIG-L family deacetylase [Anaerolineaceae bacterium]